jgi:hypothetical protein
MLPGWLLPLTQEEIAEAYKFTTEHLKRGTIYPLKGPYSANFFFICKKDGKLCPMQDYRPVNKWTKRDHNVSPLITQTIDHLTGCPLNGSCAYKMHSPHKVGLVYDERAEIRWERGGKGTRRKELVKWKGNAKRVKWGGAGQTWGRSEVGTRQERDGVGSRAAVMGAKQGGDCSRSGEMMGIELRRPWWAWLDMMA